MTVEIEETSIKGRYNLIRPEEQGEERYMRQLSKDEVIRLGMSIIKLIKD